MEIKRARKEMGKKEAYKMTMAPNMKRLSDNVGAIIEVDNFCIYEDFNDKDAAVVEVLSIMDRDGTVFATNSKTFKKEFIKIAELMGDDEYSIEVISGTSKNGRDFITCVLV